MMDVGLLYKLNTETSLKGLSFAANIRNLGPAIQYDRDSSDLPQQFVIGAGLSKMGGNLNIALDAIQSKDNGSYFLEQGSSFFFRMGFGYSFVKKKQAQIEFI